MKRVAALALVGLAFGLVLKVHSGGKPVGFCMLAALVGYPFVGTLVTIDDDFPGGWSNPDGKSWPPWLHWKPWVQLALIGCISGVGFAIDTGPATLQAVPWWLLGLGGVAVGGIVYGAAILLLKVSEVQLLLGAVKARLNR